MNRTLARKTVRDLISQAGRVLALSLILAVGTMSFVSMRAAHRDLVRARAEFYRRCKFAHFWIDVKRASLADLEWLRREPLEAVEFRVVYQARVLEPEAEGPVTATVVSLPVTRRSMVNDVVLVAGEYFAPDSAEEAIVNSAFARAHGLRPGKRMTLTIGGKEVRVRVRGVATSAEFVYLLPPGTVVPDPERHGVVYLPRRFMESVTGFRDAANQIVGRFAATTPSRQRALLNYYERRLESHGVLNAYLRESQMSHRYLSDEIQGLRTFSVVFSSFFFVVAILVLNVLMTRHVEQQRQVIGLLKALGYSHASVALHYLAQSLLVGLAGAALGGAAAEAVHAPLMGMYRRFFEFPKLEAHFYPLEHLIAATAGTLACVVGSYRTVRFALALAPSQAMRPVTPVAPRAHGFRSLPGGPLTRAAVRYILRHPVRLLAGATAAAFASSLFVTALIADRAVRYMLYHQYELVERYDWAVKLQDWRGEEVLHDLRSVVGPTATEPLATLPVEIISGRRRKKTVLIGLAPENMLFVPRDRYERPIPVGEGGLTVSRKLAQLLAVRRGDIVRVHVLVGERRASTLPVLHVVDDYFGINCYSSARVLARLAGEPGLVDTVVMRIDPGVDRAELLRRLGRASAVQAVRDRERDRTNIEQMVVELNLFFIGLLIAFAAILLTGSLYNITFISLSERRRELATMLALGFSSGEVAGLLLREIAAICVLGLVIGMPMGYGFAVLLSVLYNTEFFRMPVVAPPVVWVATSLLTAVLGLATLLLAARVLSRSRWQDWLRVFE